MNGELISEHDGFYPKTGKGAKIERNGYKIYEDEKGQYVEMYDANKRIFYFDTDILEIVLNLVSDKGNRCSLYVARTGNKNNGDLLEYVFYKENNTVKSLHSLVMNDPPLNHTVDHINDPNDPLGTTLNNRKYNLRYATQARQNHNRGKVGRKSNARPLPEGVTQQDVPTFVTYNVEQVSPGKYRYFWRIESHPVQRMGLIKDKWATSKSKKISIVDKLNEAKIKLQKYYDMLNIPENKKLFDDYLDRNPNEKLSV